jgi:hypothetical protein
MRNSSESAPRRAYRSGYACARRRCAALAACLTLRPGRSYVARPKPGCGQAIAFIGATDFSVSAGRTARPVEIVAPRIGWWL